MADRKTISYDEGNGGWTSFHSYTPEWTTRLGTKFYTFFGGELYEHDNGSTSRFYETTDEVSITFSVNEEPSSNKIFKNISLEGTASWETSVNTNLESGTIETSEYETKEGFRYGYIRQNGSRLSFSELTIVGIAPLVEAVSSTEFRFAEDVSTSILTSQADHLYFNNSSGTYFVGIINNVTAHADYGNTRDVIHVVDPPSASAVPPSFSPSVGDFCFAAKDVSSESRGIRGYYASVKLTLNNGGYAELFSVGTEAVKSFM